MDVAKIQQEVFNPSFRVPREWIPRLMDLTYRDGGLLFKHLITIENGINPGGLIVIAKNEKLILGWAMLSIGSLFVDDVDYTCNIFVDKKYRKRGIGRQLFNTVLSNSSGSIIVFPSRDSGGEKGFFSRVPTNRLRKLRAE